MDVCVYTHRYVLISKHKKIKPGPNKASQSIHMLLMTNTFLSVTLETQDWKRSWHLGHSQSPPATHRTSHTHNQHLSGKQVLFSPPCSCWKACGSYDAHGHPDRLKSVPIPVMRSYTTADMMVQRCLV